MVIISKAKLIECGERHSESIEPLNEWWMKAKAADWNNFQSIKKTFNSVDSVGNDRYVFNIKGKKFRLVAMIHFNILTVYIMFVDIHTEYDQIDCETV